MADLENDPFKEESEKLKRYGQRGRNDIAEAQGKDPLSADEMLAPEPSIGGFIKDVASRYTSNLESNGPIGGQMKNAGAVATSLGRGLKGGYQGLLRQSGESAKAYTNFGFGDGSGDKLQQALSYDNLMPKASESGDSGGDGEDEAIAEASAAETQSQQNPTGKAGEQTQEGELMNPGEPVGLNGSYRPTGRYNIQKYMDNAPRQPYEDLLSMETGIDAESLPKGTFGGMNAFNAAIAGMLPGLQANNAEQTRYNRGKELMGTDIEVAQEEAERSQPIIEMQTLPDGREIPMVMNQNGQRLDPQNIDPETGRPQVMMTEPEMRTQAQPLVDQILDNDDLNKAAKRSRLDAINSRFIQSGYQPPFNIEELL